MINKISQWIYGLDKKVYCVRRCGFYVGSYIILSKQKMIERKEYGDAIGCNGLPWVAFEGSKWECILYIDKNRLNQGLSHV